MLIFIYYKKVSSIYETLCNVVLEKDLVSSPKTFLTERKIETHESIIKVLLFFF